MKPVPIRRKGCKNAGWVWDDIRLNKIVVPLHPGKPMTYITQKFEYKYMNKRGIYILSHEPVGVLRTQKLPINIKPFLAGLNEENKY